MTFKSSMASHINPPFWSVGLRTPTAVFMATALAVGGLACSDGGASIPDMGMTGVDSGPGDSEAKGPGGDRVTTCANDPIATSSDTCSVTRGAGDGLVLRGDIVAPEGLLKNGHILVGGAGKIVCTGCDCSQEAGFVDATVVACPTGVIAPGLINAHEHVTFGEGRPIPTGSTRYDHRHEWRRGANGAVSLDTPRRSNGVEPVLYAELRHLLGGATSVAGSGGAPGFLRNLDRTGELQEGLNQAAAVYSTFPLDDAGGALREEGCSYGTIDSPTNGNIAAALAYLPHVAEGVDRAARNEFLCLSGADGGGEDVLLSKTAFIHGVGMNAEDYAEAADEGASLIWSPRTNISLYGMTAPIPLARALGVNIALGTDWPSSGSQNMLRELRCAAELDDRNNGDRLTDRQIVDLATINAAAALKSDCRLGRLAPGAEADIAIFDASVAPAYRAIIEGEPQTVALVLRSGQPLYGDEATIAALRDSGCEALDVCGRRKRVCAEADTGRTLSQIVGSVSFDTIELFACGEPPNEPTCIPFRPGEYMGIPMDGDADGDGVSDMLDNCPSVFNPPRPLDPPGRQADTDGDEVGDLCDACPFDAFTDTCVAVDPDDRDQDSVVNGMDNCPSVPNPDQADRDRDGAGDACDRCPDFANPCSGACPSTIYAVKQGLVATSGPVLIADAIVTAVGVDGYNIQIAAGDATFNEALGPDFSGLFVFDRTSPRPAVGDRVDVEGLIKDFFGQTQVEAQVLVVRSSNHPLPEPVAVAPREIVGDGVRAAALEGVLVEVTNVVVVDDAPNDGQFNEFVVTDGLLVDDFYYLSDPFPTVGQGLGFVRGPLRFANEAFKLVPRSAADIGQDPAVSLLSPAESFAPENEEAALVLQLRLTGPVSADTRVTVTSAGPVMVPGEVKVERGTTGADIPVTTLGADPTPAVVTVRLNGAEATATVRVYSETEPRDVVVLQLDSPTAFPGQTLNGRLRLGLPAPARGLAVTFGVAPALATAPPVTLTPGDTVATFQLVVGQMEGEAALTATADGRSAQASFTVSSVTIASPAAAGDVVITEIMKNPNDLTDNAGEWFEVHNPSSSISFDLETCVVTDNDGDRFTIGRPLLLSPGSYVALAKGAMPGFSPDFVWSGMNLANGGDEVVLQCGGTEIDRVEYDDATYPDDSGRSMQVSSALLSPMPSTPPHRANDLGSNWCSGSMPYNGGDQGTPGAANTSCN